MTSSTATASRWAAYDGAEPTVAPGWQLDVVVGANGILLGPPAELIEAQVFGDRVTAFDINTDVQRAFSPQR